MIQIVLILIIVFSIAYLVYLLFFSSKKPVKIDLSKIKNIPSMEIPLEELAKHIWLKYNDALAEQYYEVISSEKEPQSGNQNQEVSASQLYKRHEYETDIDEIAIEKDPVLSHLLKEIIIPYKNELENQKVFPLVKEALAILSKEGNCSSLAGVSTSNQEIDNFELKEYSFYKEVLAKVPLKEHTATVVRITIELLKKSFDTYASHVPKMLIVSLYHDLGKIPSLYQKFGQKAHPFVSANFLATLAQSHGVTPFWLEEAIQIVREHHIPGEKNVFKRILQEADRKARLFEISKSLSHYTVKKFEEWFSLDELIRDLAKVTNIDHYGPQWYAFSHKEIVYVKPLKLIDLANEQRERKKILSLEFLTEKDKTSLIPVIIEHLAKKNFLALSHLNYSKIPRFKILLQDGKTFDITLVPIKLSAFSNEEIKEITNRLHATYFSNILEVTPIG